jgi:uncharacterized protein
MAQNWHELLFAHWRVPVEAVRRLVPQGLEIDLFAGDAWLSVVPFRMSGVRLRGTPALPSLSSFPELNVRTYVCAEGRPGVWFFSLDAASRLAVEVARAWFHLPYFNARMRLQRGPDGVRYSSTRTDRRGNAERLETRYAPCAPASAAAQGTLGRFLTERYCLYAERRDGALLRGEIHHRPWELSRATASFAENTMADALGVRLAREPDLLQFAALQEVVVWAPEVLRPARGPGRGLGGAG